MALYSEGGSTTPDIYILILLLFCGLVAITLNPFIMVSNLGPPYTVYRVNGFLISALNFTGGILYVYFALEYVLPSCYFPGDTTGESGCNGSRSDESSTDISTAQKAYSVSLMCCILNPHLYTALMMAARY